MPTENAAAKARRYLGEGRLTVTEISDRGILATCKGDSGEVYVLGYIKKQNRWGCQCEANSKFKRECSHLKALKLVTVKP